MPKIQLKKPIDVNQVYLFAKAKHEGQKRDNGADYISHPVSVAKIIKEVKGDSKNIDILVAAALLHDTLEDTYTSYRELEENFGKEIASIVMELTTAPFVPKMIGKAKYLATKMENMTNYALLIKFADRYNNLCDLNGTTQEKRQRTISDTEYILNYLSSRRTYTTSQQKLVDLIQKQINELKNEDNEKNAITK
ncbi:MAG: HD domain-containing protein [Christensenellales bacterium]